MKKVVTQFRYYNDTDVYKNSPSNINSDQLVSGTNNIFKSYCPILQLGIQALPGTKFYLNGDGTSNVDPIIVGSTGIFEIDFQDGVEISSLSFSKKSLNAIADNDNAYLIIDIVYEVEE